MGGAQPLAVTLNGGVCLIVDVDASRLQRRLRQRYLDEVAEDLDDALARCEVARQVRSGRSVGLAGNCATVLPELLRRGAPVDVVTDQTSAHDPLSYLPVGVEVADWHGYAAAEPEEFTARARASMAAHVEAMVGFQDAGAEVFDYGNSIREEARKGGCARAFEIEGFVPLYVRPLFCEGKGPLPLGRTVGRREGHRGDGRGRPRAVPGRRPPAALGQGRVGSASPSRGCRRGSAGSATGSGSAPAYASTTW